MRIFSQVIVLLRLRPVHDPCSPLTIFISLILLIAACAGNRNAGDVTRETLASGVERTTWHRLPEIRLSLDTLAVWDLWASDSGYIFSDVHAAYGSPESFFLVDLGNQQIVRTDLQGQVGTVFGRRGSGPGEFEMPMQIFIRDNEIWIGDLGLRRYTLFGPDGSFRRIRSWSPGFGRGINANFAITAAGDELFLIRSIRGFRGLLLAPPDSTAADTIAEMRTHPTTQTPVEIPGVGRTTMYDPPAYSPDLYWAWGENECIYTITSADYRIEERDLSGRVVRELVAPTPDLTVTAADREAFLTRFAELYGVDTEEFRRSNPQFESRYPFAERRPALEGIMIDPLGRIWVLANSAGSTSQRIDLFDRDLTFIGSLEDLPLPKAFTPAGAALFRITGGDEDGNDLFFVARIAR